jgi:hypothetical protein
MTDTNKDELLNNGDFVFMQRTGGNGQTEIIGGGYKINSFLLQGGICPMTTYNTNDQMGGKVSSSFENLAVPAGLFYVNMRFPKKDSEKQEQFYQKHDTISDDMIDKLFGLVEADKKRKRKTRKYSTKLDKTKTRKHK